MENKRIVVKVGTSTLTHESGRLNLKRTEQLVKVLCDLSNAGHQIILVSSGAVGVGVGKLGLKNRPKETREKQAVAAVGQCELMFIYDKMFGEYNHTVAQVLLTKYAVDTLHKKQNVVNTIETLLEMGIIPIVNENDTCATDELAGDNIGDNDSLSAIVADISSADMLIMLTDIDGLYTANPREDKNAKFISTVDKIDEKIMNMGSNHTGSSVGTGGMHTKLNAGRIATASGIDMIIANASDIHVIHRLMDGREFGTFFKANKDENFNLVEIAEGLNED